MFRKIRAVIIVLILLSLLATAVVYGILTMSLPTLSGTTVSKGVTQEGKIQRDALGTAIIIAENRQDASYLLGYAHGQDRFFQMDLLRRNAAGELTELFGNGALKLDEDKRFHLFRKRSQEIVKQLPPADQAHLQAYTDGVNDALGHQAYPSFEYVLSRSERKPWKPEDSLLVIFSMYLDLQGRSIDRDMMMEILNTNFGPEMVAFVNQPSSYQAALDGSEFAISPARIPKIDEKYQQAAVVTEIDKSPLVGSNNWAVGGELTESGKAMLSDDMHLGMNVPTIWYRAQLNYQQDGDARQITGVTLPGAPAVVVGTNGHVAWGFTNGYLDSADWYKLADTDSTKFVTEKIPTKSGDHSHMLEISNYGPVRYFNGQPYALSWVAYQDYAVNLGLLKLEGVATVEEGLAASKEIGIPVQNMVLADSNGSIAWQATGAIPNRRAPQSFPKNAAHFDEEWRYQATDVPFVVNPENARIWTGNSRVVSVEQDARFGNGGYALGARSQQIRDRLNEKADFAADDFYDIQLDNEAKFLARWHELLLQKLQQRPKLYAQDIQALKDWQACACADSVGYTLVRKYRDALMDSLFASVETVLNHNGVSIWSIERQLEPALWQLVGQTPKSWLPKGFNDWDVFFISTYESMKQALMLEMTGHTQGPLSALRWGDVNTLKVQHPFSRQMPLLSKLLDMPAVEGFGDRYMPAVQGRSFGASQRLIVQPGNEKEGILTVPGGQSGHPLSPFYRRGFDEYAEQGSTPLLPGEPVHEITFRPAP
ncbi:penicillin acylase family protein [Enterovibrio sp. ZSDZ35]|uniref:Penicillin acylase family protein n=1 Tax=Enterovibrio qingdaonensis TaxID=2899818 RepID=A0ABT5QSK4_9GAMM|nr:penicillin acylase family protein [Enterovibrio sp. ZSDZ35]MDD1783678.1 penicillin acylase family protein [Enterovibrio sp. ZSDZ35]